MIVDGLITVRVDRDIRLDTVSDHFRRYCLEGTDRWRRANHGVQPFIGCSRRTTTEEEIRLGGNGEQIVGRWRVDGVHGESDA